MGIAVELGSKKMSDIVPGLAQAIAALQAEAAVLSAMKADKNSALSQLSANVAGLNSVLHQANALITEAEGLLDLCQGALDNCDALVAAFAASLAASGIHLISYAGAVGDMGTDVGNLLTNGLPGGAGATQEGFALVLITTDGGAWNAVTTIMGVS